MDYVHWEKEFEIGIPFIDADHRLLVQLINQANDAADKRSESAILSSILGTLYDYTKYHFFREEKLMEFAGHAGLENHRKEHQSLADRVREIDESFCSNSETLKALELRDFLKDWLIDHISGEDFNYREDCLANLSAQEKAGAISFMEDERS